MQEQVRHELERAGEVLLSEGFWDTYAIEVEDWYLLHDAATGALCVQFRVRDAFLGGTIREKRWPLPAAKGAVPEYVWKTLERMLDPEHLVQAGEKGHP